MASSSGWSRWGWTCAPPRRTPPPSPPSSRPNGARSPTGWERRWTLRELSRGIHPAILSEGGLGPARKALARRSAVPVEADLEIETRLPAPVEAAAYVVSEALTNAAKHAHASVVHVAVRARPDGGSGLPAAACHRGLPDPRPRARSHI